MRSNNALVDSFVRRGTLRTPSIIAAFQAVDSKYFVTPSSLGLAYEAYPLDIGYKAIISQPTTVTFMLETLAPQERGKVLDIGSGSGWTTALLVYIVGATGAVSGVEVVPELVKWGSNNLKRYPLSKAEIVQAGKRLGMESKAPFDNTLVSASARQLPEEIITQLAVGGTLVIPIEEAIWQINKTSATQH